MYIDHMAHAAFVSFLCCKVIHLPPRYMLYSLGKSHYASPTLKEGGSCVSSHWWYNSSVNPMEFFSARGCLFSLMHLFIRLVTSICLFIIYLFSVSVSYMNIAIFLCNFAFHSSIFGAFLLLTSVTRFFFHFIGCIMFNDRFDGF